MTRIDQSDVSHHPTVCPGLLLPHHRQDWGASEATGANLTAGHRPGPPFVESLTTVPPDPATTRRDQGKTIRGNGPKDLDKPAPRARYCLHGGNRPPSQ